MGNPFTHLNVFGLKKVFRKPKVLFFCTKTFPKRELYRKKISKPINISALAGILLKSEIFSVQFLG